MRVQRANGRGARRLVSVCAFLLAGALLLAGSAQAQAGRVDSITYVALGDSYTSGEGNRPFVEDGSACHRSRNNAWPASVRNSAGERRIDFTANLACSGALTGAMTSSFKGQKPQLEALKLQRPTPDLLTLTLGGNDVGFAKVVESCFRDNCVANGLLEQTRNELEQKLAGKLDAAYAAIRNAAPAARIIVVGYPKIFPQGSTRFCPIILSQRELDGLSDLASRLDVVVETAARKASFEYISTLSIMAGHENCTGPRSWMVPVYGQGGAHPDPEGQAAIAQAVNRHLAQNSAR